MHEKLKWTDVEEIAILLFETHPDTDPAGVRFTELKQLVAALPGFEPEPGHDVNEQILEAIQASWIEESQDNTPGHRDGDGYRPPSPFRPDE